MKKRTKSVKKSTARKTSHHHAHHSHTDHILLVPFSFRRIILVTTCLVLVLVGILAFNKNQINQSVAGASTVNPSLKKLFAQTTITIPSIEGATSYNVYYKQQSDSKYIHADRNIKSGATSETVYFLKSGKVYQYYITAVKNGKEFWKSDVMTFTATQAMK